MWEHPEAMYDMERHIENSYEGYGDLGDRSYLKSQEHILHAVSTWIWDKGYHSDELKFWFRQLDKLKSNQSCSLNGS